MDKPTLSIVYPGTHKPPLTLSSDDQYTSALFTRISGQEYLVAASRDGIHLWNPAKNTKSVVNTLEKGRNWHLCAIDERTIAYVTERPSSGGFSKIHILNTDSEKFSLSSTLWVKAGEAITDMCYLRTTDGTSCLLLSFPLSCQCVEIVTARKRSLGQGNIFTPVLSFCSRGACVVLFGGASMVAPGGHAWFYLGGMRGFIRGVSMVLFGGCAWFYSGGHAWFFQFFRIQ